MWYAIRAFMRAKTEQKLTENNAYQIQSPRKVTYRTL